MADPKYADLPGIATDQPDTYETNSDRGQDTVRISAVGPDGNWICIQQLCGFGLGIQIRADINRIN